MKKIGLLLLFLIFPFLFGGKVLFTEQAVFKIEEKVFLLSDIQKMKKAFVDFYCLIPNSKFLQYFELEKGSIKDIPDFDSKVLINLSLESHYFQKLLRIFKLDSFSRKNNLKVEEESFKNLPWGNCSLSRNEISKELKLLLLEEAFWNDRYGDEGKLKDSISSFIKTLDKQIPHELYY